MQPQKLFGDDTLYAEKQNITQCHDKRRGHDGQQRHKSEKAFTRNIQSGNNVCKEECHSRTGHRGDQGHEQAVFQGCEPTGFLKQLHIVLSAGERDNPDHRVYHEEPNEKDNRDNGQH